MATFGNRFKELRLEKELTQQQFATIFYLNKSSISRYEKDKQIPEMETLLRISQFFNVSLDYLIGNSDIRNPEKVIYNNASNSISTKGLSEQDIAMIKSMIERLKNQGQ